MLDDPLAALEAELVNAARRRAVGAGRVIRLRPSVGGLATVVAAVAAVVIAIGAIVLLGRHGSAQQPAAPGQTHTASSHSIPLRLEPRIRALIGTLASGQAGSRETQSVLSQLGFDRYTSTTFTAGAATAPGPVRIQLWEVATQPSGHRPLDVLGAFVHGKLATKASAAQVLARGLLVAYGYTASGTRVAVIVPNQVAEVRLDVPGASSLLSGVHDNVAAFQIKGIRLVQIVGGSRMTWYRRNGQVLQRTGPVGPLP